MVRVLPQTRSAYRLLHQGTQVMSEMEHNGLRVDLNYLEKIQQQVEQQIKKLERALVADPVFRRWKRKYGDRTKLGNRTQLGDILFREMKIPYPRPLARGRDEDSYQTMDEDVLEDVDLPFVRSYIQMHKLIKIKNTYLRNIAWETVDGICHPNQNLHLVRTYRGSSDHPNFTNMPVRDELFKKYIRRCFRARPGRRLVDLDFKGAEVNAAAWYHKDPVMLEYIRTDPGRLHLDMAGQCYKLPLNLITHEIRHCGKNMFVFPQFYGDWYLSCAQHLWRAIDRMHLKTKSGIPLKKWLRQHGITSLGDCIPGVSPLPGTFEFHIQQVERDFWRRRFSVYQQWKEDWWAQYQEQGFLQMLTGFLIQGYLNRKNVINYPVQGTAFHCLLWCLIRIRELIHKERMPVLLVGQIHDDGVADVREDCLQDYLALAQNVITVQLKKHWPWIITPMRVEIEVTPIGGTWYDKQEYKNQQ